MNTPLTRHISLIYGLFAFCLMSLPISAATTAGRVVFALGQPQATDTSGAQRILARGDEVYTGDSLTTAARGRLQISLIDGAYISVQPDSTYVIEEYEYSGTPDGTEKSTYRLVKGGVRALTGLIGKSRPEAYKVNTAVATIGIRGTGHNTRLCLGDCGTLPDGLYHNTWEGITYVENNVDSKDVPSGRGVYVRDINTEIEFMEQTPGVTAAVVAAAITQEEEVVTAEKADEMGNPPYEQGEAQQVTSTVSILPDFLMSAGFSSTSFSLTGDFGSNDVFGFFNGSGQLTGALLTFISSSPSTSSPPYGEIRTIDLTAMQNGNDPVATQIVNDIVAFASSDNLFAENLTRLQTSPASVAESFTDAALGVGWGRWANGHVLTLFSDFQVFSEVTDLVNNQSVHFIFGPEPPVALPTTGRASYNFIGGTQSTSLSGATIGTGVTSGTIDLNFLTAFGTLDMEVNHNSTLYTVLADLFASDVEFIFGGGDATSTASGSACLSFCSFSLIGSFAGTTTDGPPRFINFEYEIDETDPIIGVASFQFGSMVLASSTVISADGFIVVEPDLTKPEQVDVTFGNSISIFLDSSNQLIGVLFTNTDFFSRDFGTIDLDAVLGGDDPTVVSEVQSLFNSAPGATTAAATVAANPASPADFFYDTTNGIGWGRWTNGNFLTFSDDGSPAEVVSLTGNQSVHLLIGNAPPDISGLTTTATYNFIGGTSSTTASGAGPAGNGVTSGSMVVNFGLSDASLNMIVNHGVDYSISGTLFVDALDASLYDAFPGDVTATSSSPGCISFCTVFIDGGFAGPVATGGVPQFAGFEYDIQDSVDVIMGVAAFEVGP